MTRFIEIKEIHEPELNIYAQLSEGQLLHYYEPAEGLFIAESPMIIQRALDAGYRPLSMLVEHRLAESQGRELAMRCGDIPVYTAEREVLEQITGYALTRGMLCAMYRKPLLDAAVVCRDARRIVVLENVMNPTNVGAVFRSAAALGMDGILLTPGGSDPLYRRAIRVSMGTVFQIPWTFLNLSEESRDARSGTDWENQGAKEGIGWEHRDARSGTDWEDQGAKEGNSWERRNTRNEIDWKSQGAREEICRESLDMQGETARDRGRSQGSRMVSFLHRLGFKTAAMALREDSVSLEDPRLRAEERLAIVLGTEGDGLAADTIADCDYTVRIPMAHGVDSLNVAAASAVAFWQLGRRGEMP